MNINPYYIAKRGIDLICSYKPQIDSLISQYETNRSLNCFHGIRPSIPSSQFPCFEIETTSVDTEWATTRGQRHRISFQCLVTVSCPKIDYREEYLLRMTSAVVSILQDPKHLRFPVDCETLSMGDKCTLFVYDSMVSSVGYSSRDGTIGVGNFVWTASVHETIPDANFGCIPSHDPGIVKPTIKEIK